MRRSPWAGGVVQRPVAHEWFRAHAAALGEAAHRVLRSGPLGQLRIILESYFDPVVDAMFDAAQALAEESDLLIGHFLLHPLATAAAVRAKPLVLVATAPAMPTRFAPPMGAPDLGFLNPWLWRLADAVAKRVVVPRANGLRDRVGAPRVSSLLGDGLGAPGCILTAVSPALFPRPRDWSESWDVVGFLELPADAEGWTAPPDLERFLREGEPPVFLTFGSMMLLDPALARESVALLAESAALAGVRALLQAPPALTQGVVPTKSLHLVERLPHAAVFSRCAAIVHHGGAGTTQAVLAAGRPSVLVPHLMDQFFWAQRLERLGAASGWLRRRGARPARLARLIRGAVANGAVRRSAEAVGEVLRAERGVERAVDAVEAFAASRHLAARPLVAGSAQ
jgi:sterol 3beta-glucosyltransferase